VTPDGAEHGHLRRDDVGFRPRRVDPQVASGRLGRCELAEQVLHDRLGEHRVAVSEVGRFAEGAHAHLCVVRDGPADTRRDVFRVRAVREPDEEVADASDA
jgi:hypothetical protein